MTELALTDREKRRLKTLEDGIRNSGKMMYESMRAIHDERLYRDEFKTWEDYCAARWNMGRAHSYRLIEHGKVLALLNDDPVLSPIGDIPESVTRELNGIPDTKKVEVVKAVVANTPSTKAGTKRITAAAVKAEVAKSNGHAKNGKPKPKTREVSPAKMVDALVRDYVSPLVRAIDAVAEVNGGKGGYHNAASKALDNLIAAMREMREGKQ